ncbi:MAG: ABC transporter substrate-binding protein [Segniliparus sp.]|uniref:ABC transporter substrate-binding protein n=1 Tax=Segniliparus sp. TaxID=2804064 RepID=UPI003F3817D5
MGTRSITRRSLGAAAVAALALGGCQSPSGQSPTSPAQTSPAASAAEQQEIDQLYQQAKAEGGKLVIYAGGDKPNQQDYLKDAFVQRFPGIEVHDVVDFSKLHDGRIDNQLATTGKTVADVVQLQTVNDFPRWKQEGKLAQFKPASWEHIDPRIKDPDGYYTGAFFYFFAEIVNDKVLAGRKAPEEAQDFLAPELANSLTITYPNDDDAVLFYFKQLVDKYGWDYLAKLVAQHPTFVRGTQDSSDAVTNGHAAASLGTSGPASPGDSRAVIPQTSPWVAWAQTAAVLKSAPHPAAARLYLSWLTSKEVQEKTIGTWSSRNDVAPPAGRKPIWDYTNTDPLAFVKFMSDRAAVEQFRTQATLYVGEVVGANPNGDLGLAPGAF